MPFSQLSASRTLNLVTKSSGSVTVYVGTELVSASGDVNHTKKA